MQVGKADDMREQELMRMQMQQAYRLGDSDLAGKLKGRLKPDEPVWCASPPPLWVAGLPHDCIIAAWVRCAHFEDTCGPTGLHSESALLPFNPNVSISRSKSCAWVGAQEGWRAAAATAVIRYFYET